VVRDSLWAQLAPYRQQHAAARWLPPQTWHLTLLFLGPVPVEHVSTLADLIEETASRTSRARLAVAGGGGRIRGEEAVAWLAVGSGAGHVLGLADDLAARCPDGLTTGPPPRRTPSAHLTVARRADASLIDDLASQGSGPVTATWRSAHLALVRSHLGPGGARYERLHEAPLAEGP
jgi:2'-5' RNA ligase